MKVNVKLYGTLGRFVDDYDHQTGLEVEIPDESTRRDLQVYLNLKCEGIGMVFMDGRPVTEETKLTDGGQIRIFQPIFGG